MPGWSVLVEFGAAPDDDTITTLQETLVDTLAAHSPVPGRAPSGNLSVRLFVDAGDPLLAASHAIDTLAQGMEDRFPNWAVSGLEVLTEDELTRQLAEPLVPALVGISDIARRANVSRQRAARLVQREDFPPAIQELATGPVFLDDQVEDWLRAWDRTGGRRLSSLDLTPVERAVLETLAAAAANSSPEEMTSDHEAVRGAIESIHPDGRLEVRYAPAEDDLDLEAAVASLVQHRLLRSSQPAGDPEHALVTVTAKGNRHASAS